MSELRAPREIERRMLAEINKQLRARGASEILSMEMSQRVRGECLAVIVTPDRSEPFEVLLPYVAAFPQMLAAVPPHGNA